MKVDQFWECPRCGTQMGSGRPAVLGPPTCSMAHEPAEMEQKTIDAWRGPRNLQDHNTTGED